jgi:hypothetical protein
VDKKYNGIIEIPPSKSCILNKLDTTTQERSSKG